MACYQKHYLSYLSAAHVFGNAYTVYLRETGMVYPTVSRTFNVYTGICSNALSQAVTDGETECRETQLVSRRTQNKNQFK